MKHMGAQFSRMKKSIVLVALAGVGALSHVAAQTPAPNTATTPAQVRNTPISLQGAGPYYRLALPITLYPSAAHADLRELRVRNASGQVVPFAWARTDTAQAPELSTHKPTLFPLKASAGVALEDAPLVFKPRADGSLVLAKPSKVKPESGVEQWIIDTSQIGGAMLQARFTVEPSTEGLFAFRLDASDDLRQWREISGLEQLVLLTRSGAKIERLSAELGSTRARYLRLRWQNPTQSVWLTGIEIDSVATTEPVPRHEWTGSIKAQPCSVDYCDYLLPANTPAESLRIALTEPNTLASLRVMGLLPVVKPSNYERNETHVRRNPLHALRKKQEPISTVPVPPNEVALANTVVYRLTLPGGDAVSPNIALDAGVYTSLRLRAPGIANLLGQTAPSIDIASTPRSLVFLARGTGPFQLSWGKDTDDAGPIPLANLVPGYVASKPLTADVATVSIAAAALPVAAPVTHPSPTPPDPPAQKGWLWAALALGVMLLGAMAWSLLRAMQKPSATE